MFVHADDREATFTDAYVRRADGVADGAPPELLPTWSAETDAENDRFDRTWLLGTLGFRQLVAAARAAQDQPSIPLASDDLADEEEVAAALGCSRRMLRHALARFPPELQPITTGTARLRRRWPRSQFSALRTALQAPIHAQISPQAPVPSKATVKRRENRSRGSALDESVSLAAHVRSKKSKGT